MRKKKFSYQLKLQIDDKAFSTFVIKKNYKTIKQVAIGWHVEKIK